jgi:hypothetical protein
MRRPIVGGFLAAALGGSLLAAPPDKHGPHFTEDASQVVAAFKAKIPAPFLVTELHIGERHASIEVQDPRKKDTYDEYSFLKGAEVKGPEPQQVFSVSCKKGFSIDEADFTQVPVMLKDAVARLNLEDGEANSLHLSRGVFCKEPRWMISVKGTRKDGYVEYDPKGKFRNMKIM